MKTQKSNFLGFLLFTLILTLLMLLLCSIENHLVRKKSKNVIGNREYTVILDAGHGGEDGGTSSADGVLEKDLNLSISKNIGTYLKQCGFSVIYTRTEDILLYDRNENYQGRKKILDLAARLKLAREQENAIFVSIHMNAFPKKQYSGLQVYYSSNHPMSETLASTIQQNVKSTLDNNNHRKIKKADSSIYLLDRLEKPAILIECGFLSNDAEAKKLSTSEYQKQLSLIISKSIIECINNSSYER